MVLSKVNFFKKYITMNDGATIALWDTKNEAMPLVFVHGFPENHHCWDHLLSSLPTNTTKNFRLITYDLRGFGESSKTGEASIIRLYEDHQTIIETLQLPSYHLIGHDWGGSLALQIARFDPQPLTSATVMNTNFWKTDLSGMWHLIFLNIPLLPKLVFKWFPKRFFEFALLRSFADPNSLKPQIIDGYFDMFCDKRLCEKAGVRYFRFHPIRHSGASVMDGNNVPIGAIQRILGHENRKTTEIYLHSIGDLEREAINAFEQARKKSHTKSHTDGSQKKRESSDEADNPLI